MLLTYAAVLDAEKPETLHRACELLQDLDNYFCCGGHYSAWIDLLWRIFLSFGQRHVLKSRECKLILCQPPANELLCYV